MRINIGFYIATMVAGAFTCTAALAAGHVYGDEFSSHLRLRNVGDPLIYVNAGGRLQIFRSDGKPKASGNHSLNGLAADATGNVRGAQLDNAVHTYTADAREIAPTIKHSFPYSTAVDASGKIYVGTQYRNSFTPGIYTYTAQGQPTTPTILLPQAFAFSVAVDVNDKIYALENLVGNNGAIKMFSYLPNGKTTKPAIDISGIPCPSAIAVDSLGKIYISSVTCGGQTGGVFTFSSDGTPTSPTISLATGAASTAIDASGKIYVLSYGTPLSPSVVTSYSYDGKQTTPTINLGSAGDAISVE